MWSITLLLIPCVLCYGFLYSITMHWCSSYVIAQRWVSAKPLSGLQPTTSVFCYSLFFVWSCQSIAVFFVVWHHDKNNLTLKILSRAIKIAKVTCSSWASVTKPADEVLAGQKRYAAAEWERAWTRSPRALSGCSGIADSPFPDPSPSVFPVASLCSGRYSVCASSWSLKLCLYFILFYLRSQDESAQWLHPCASSHPVPLSLAGFVAILSIAGFLRSCRQREFDSSLSHHYGCAVDNESSTRCQTQAVSRLCRFQARCVDKPSLNAAQTLDEQSANAAVRELECVCRGWTVDTMPKW
jgi:hypothetical protein